jgi:hypothetical protein
MTKVIIMFHAGSMMWEARIKHPPIRAWEQIGPTRSKERLLAHIRKACSFELAWGTLIMIEEWMD